MSDVRTHPAYADLAKAIADAATPEEIDRFFQLSMDLGQALYVAAWVAAQQQQEQHRMSVPVLVSAILDAAWALSAAQAEDQPVLGELGGFLIGVEERLTQSADGIRRFYYPEWRRLLAEQGPPKAKGS